MLPVLCYGDICADLLIPYGHALAAKTAAVDPDALTVRFSHGGSVANTAVTLARLGAPVLFLGTAGQDAFGRTLKTGLEQEGVDASLLTLKEDTMTTMVLLVLDEQGERVPFAYPRIGASQHAITADQIPSDILSRISCMHSSGMTLREEPAAGNQLALMRRCHAAGIPVALDVNARVESLQDHTFARNMQEALEHCDILFGSAEDELCPLAGETDPLLAAERLLEKVPMVIARRGEKGAAVYTRQGAFSCPAFSVPIRDRVGAGDVYDGAFLAALLEGHTPQEANRRACAAGAWCVSHFGGRSGPTSKELRSVLDTGILQS
jgi:sugar/nucleoside kinase (ribokinase family)